MALNGQNVNSGNVIINEGKKHSSHDVRTTDVLKGAKEMNLAVFKVINYVIQWYPTMTN